VSGPRQPARNQPAVPAEHGTVAVPKHPMSALTTFELRDYRRDLTKVPFPPPFRPWMPHWPRKTLELGKEEVLSQGG
jgi:hypothetical protein